MMTFEFLSKYQYYGKLPSASVILNLLIIQDFFLSTWVVILTHDLLKILHSCLDIDTNRMENLTQ